MMKTVICCILLASIALIEGKITRPIDPQSCDSDINPLNKCTRISDYCSNAFIERCANLSDNVDNRLMTFFPNCFGHTTEYEANSLMNQFISLIDTLSENCTDLAIPLMCFGLYPKCLGQYRLAPCPELCNQFMAECIPPDMPVPWNCDQLFRSGPCVNNTNEGICIKPDNDDSLASTSPSSNESLPNCTGTSPSKCGLIRESISWKAFTKGFYFAAHVKVLTKKMKLINDETLIIIKVKIVQDYYFDCSSNCSGQKNVSSISYIITDDDPEDCTKQCIRPHLEIGKNYFVMGTSREYKELGHVWKLTGQTKTGGCVVYPWDDVKKDKKAKKLIRWANKHYKCIKDCTRVLE